jgi:eukaryotic-like serine/threonine-protein kinase
MLMIGQTVSHYKIIEKLGEGGMGVVYKAQDTNLDRAVALKFLPPSIAASEQDKARFIQEAKAAAALNHPNICTIYGIEEYDGQAFIAMELVDGQTLRDSKQTFSLKQTIDIGIQIADGLAAAHEKGIVHRDIKPENIMVRKDGIVQIMDFGLAKLRGASRLTKEGTMVGTVGYMSPEQVQGQDTDHRTDIFSLGVILYELLSGQSPFKGVHETAIIYEIVNVDAAPMSSLKPEIDAELDAIVLECLAKEKTDRYQSVAEVAKELRRFKRESSKQRVSRVSVAREAYRPSGVQSLQNSELAEPVGRNVGWLTRPMPWMLACGVLLLASLALAVVHFRETVDVRVVRSSILPVEKTNFVASGGGHLALSPDGRMLAYSARDSLGKILLWVRPLSAVSGQAMSGTEGAEYPFWSPDSRFIGFFATGKLKKIEATGGPPQSVCDAASGRGGSWSREGIILFAAATNTPIFRVSAAGGDPVAVTVLDTLRHENSHRWPYFLPDGKHFLFFARAAVGGMNESDAIFSASLDSAEKTKLIIRASSSMAYAGGLLVFMREQSLMAQPFDADRLQTTGDAFPIAEQIQYDGSFNRANFSISENGILAYQSGFAVGGRMLTWYDRTGKKLGVVGKLGEYFTPRLSPDGKRLAVDLYDPQSRNIDVWLCDIGRDVWTRFTFDLAIDRWPVWSQDGSRIFFSSNRKNGHYDIYQRSSGGAGNDELALSSGQDKVPTNVSADGKFLAYYTTGSTKTQSDLWVLPLSSQGAGGDRQPIQFLQTEFTEQAGVFSPDGRWLAYVSNESSKSHVYVRPFPGPGGKYQVSTVSGARPRWRKDGKEIFYLADDNKLMAAEVKSSGASFEVGVVHALFETHPYQLGQAYDCTADGQRFLVNTIAGEETSSPVTLVVNWNVDLKKK